EAAGVAIVQAAEAGGAASWKDILQLSVLGVGADEAVRAAQRLMRGVPLEALRDEAGDVTKPPSGDGDIAVRVQIEARRAAQLRSNATPSPISCENLKWTLPEDLAVDTKLTKVHPHYRRSGGAAAALRRLWAEQSVATLLVDDVIGILRGSCSEEHATEGSPTDLLSWTCGNATAGEIKTGVHADLSTRREHEGVFQPVSDIDKDDDIDKSINGWKEWSDDKYLCPSIGAQLVFSTLCDMSSEKRSTALQQICENVNEVGHDPIKLSTSLQMRIQRICLEVIVEALLLPPGSELQSLAAQYVASHSERISEDQMHISLLTHFVSKVLQSVATKTWKYDDNHTGELLKKRKPRLQTMSPTDHLFSRLSPLWSYNEEIRDQATMTALSQVSSQGPKTSLQIVSQCLFALLSPPNSLHRSIVMSVITELTKAINWNNASLGTVSAKILREAFEKNSYNNVEAFAEIIGLAQAVSPAATKVLIEVFATTQPSILFDCFNRRDAPTRLRASIVSTSVFVYGQRPQTLDSYFEDIRLLSVAGSMLVSLGTSTDRDSKELEAILINFLDRCLRLSLEVILINFFDRLAVHIDAQHNDAWLTPDRAHVLCQNECGLLWQHPTLDKLRRTLLARFLADGVITADEQLVFSKFLGATGMTVSLTRQGCVVLDETEYRMQGDTVEFLAANNAARTMYPRATEDARTAAAEFASAASLMVEGNVLETGDAVLSLLHDEGSATQLVVFERRTAFGDVVVRTVDRLD
ncbi:Hypothetical protein, putative, partial [Bodo saltans]